MVKKYLDDKPTLLAELEIIDIDDEPELAVGIRSIPALVANEQIYTGDQVLTYLKTL
tara:strand:+ start:317 stop:487 length:171 start_codon:yes stop_codon:yes gene_type:complete